MQPDELRRHLDTLDQPGRLAALLGGCWPGGGDDRLERAAVPWLRAWRPARSAARIPVCSCRRGPCAVCN